MEVKTTELIDKFLIRFGVLIITITICLYKIKILNNWNIIIFLNLIGFSISIPSNFIAKAIDKKFNTERFNSLHILKYINIFLDLLICSSLVITQFIISST